MMHLLAQVEDLYAAARGLGGDMPPGAGVAADDEQADLCLVGVGDMAGDLDVPAGGVVMRLLVREERPHPWRGPELTTGPVNAPHRKTATLRTRSSRRRTVKSS